MRRITTIVSAVATLFLLLAPAAQAGVKRAYTRAYYSTAAACEKTPGPNLRREGVPPDGRPALERHYRAAIRRLERRRAACAPPLAYAAASWYGPGLYGNTMACGGALAPGTVAVAHKSLPCGTRLEFHYRGRRVVAPVRDRGPYVGGRTFDLTAGTARALGFGGVGTVGYRVLR